MKYTYKDFQTEYPDDDACLGAILKRQLAVDPSCHGCGITPAKFHKITGRRGYACQDCGHHIYPCVGTIFDHSSTNLTKWFHAMYLMTATRNGVSAKELERQLGVTYKCAWRIGHQLRQLMSARAKAMKPGPLEGHVEVDEAFVGGKKSNTKRRRMPKDSKAVVFGMVERGGHLRGQVVPDAGTNTLIPVIMDNVMPGSTVSSDEWAVYKHLPKLGYVHGFVKHQADEYVNGIHHTQTLDGFWSHLKRGIRSTHVAVSKKHLQKYVEEFAFRFNNRHAPADMFRRMLAQVSNPQHSLP
jgi:transposase-like protein